MHKIDQDTIRRQLQKLNIPYDMKIVRETYLFLNKFIGPLSQEDAQYNIPAACAIMCQIIKIPTIDHQKLTSSGIKIENVMRHIGNLSKQKFLDTIEIQIKKSDVSNHSLIQKIGNIRIAFRVFKKYKTIFQHLSTQNKIPYQIKQYLLDFYWLIFLIAKQNLSALENLILSTKILVMVIQQVFTNYYGRASKTYIRNYISQRDNFTQLPAIFQQQQFQIKSQIYNLVNNTIQSRNSSWTPISNNLLENSGLLERLVNDLNYQYDKMYEILPEGRYIDQSTFLQLTKNLTPQAFIQKSSQQPISKILSFDDDDDDDNGEIFGNDDNDNDSNSREDNTMKKQQKYSDRLNCQQIATSLFRSASLNGLSTNKIPINIISITPLTPVSLGQTKAVWAQNFVLNYESIIQPEVRKHFENKQILFDNVVKQTQNKISMFINTLLQHSISKPQASLQILKMCFTFAYDLINKKPHFNVTDPKNFNSLLCISTYIYILTIRFSQLELQKYCQVYKTDILDCLKVVYQISDCQNMPEVIKNLLSNLEKEVLIKQLWDNDRGYELLIEGKTPSNQIIFNRLNRRTHQRVVQICQASNVDLKEVKKIQSLIQQIFKHKPDIIKKNKLDQILICAICACLNLNQAKYNLALSTIFQKYHSIPLSLHSNKQIQGNNQQGAPKTLLEFYNKVFINQVQEMMSQEENPKYLYTPIRENHLKKIRGIMESTGGLKPNVGLVKNASRDSEASKSYQNKIKQRLKQPKQQEIEEQQCNSPYFGRLPCFKRKFTFGKDQD